MRALSSLDGKNVIQHQKSAQIYTNLGRDPSFFQPELLVSGEDLEGPEAEPGGRQSEDDGGLLVLHPAVVEAVPRDRVIRHLA